MIAGCDIGEGGLGLPTQREGEAYPGVREEVRSTLEVAPNGCLQIDLDGTGWFVIWPAGSQLANRVRLPNGQEIAEGDTVVGSGAFTPTGPLVANRNGYWHGAIGYCAPEAVQVVVFDTAQRGS